MLNHDKLSMTFMALGDPTRRAILVQLSKGEASVSELAKPFLKQMSAPAITKHIKVLEKAGLISKSKEAQWRPCKLNGEAFKEVSNWLEFYRHFWEESFDRLDQYLQNELLKNKNLKSAAKKNIKKGKPHVKKK